MIDKLFGEVKGIFNIITIIDAIISIIFLMLGLTFFTNPSTSNVLVSIVVGIFLVINGGISIFSYFKRRDIDLFNYNLYIGIVLIIVGVLAMIFKNILTIMLGIYIVICGIQKVIYGVIFKKFNESSWLLTVVIGILFFVIGIVSFFTGGDALVKATGICIFGYGAINLADIILIRKRSKYFLS